MLSRIPDSPPASIIAPSANACSISLPIASMSAGGGSPTSSTIFTNVM